MIKQLAKLFLSILFIIFLYMVVFGLYGVMNKIEHEVLNSKSEIVEYICDTLDIEIEKVANTCAVLVGVMLLVIQFTIMFIIIVRWYIKEATRLYITDKPNR